MKCTNVLNNQRGKNLLIIVLAVFVFNLSYTPAFAAGNTYEGENVIKLRDKDESGGGISVQQRGIANIENSPYYPRIDFYKSSPTSTIIKLDKFKTYQQTTGYSCGAACCLMALNYFGVNKLTDGSDVSERWLMNELNTRDADNKNEDGSYGTSTRSIVNFFERNGYKVKSPLKALGSKEDNKKPF